MITVNYIPDAQNNGKFNFDIFIYKNFKNWTINTKDMGNCENYKIAKKHANKQSDHNGCL